MGKLDFKHAEQVRLNLTREQAVEIRAMYRRISRNIGKEAQKLPPSTSGSLRKWYLKELQKQINEQISDLGKDLKQEVLSNMDSVVDAVIEDNLAFMKYVNMPIYGAFSHVPKDIIKTIITGQLYDGDWSLSKAIWKITKKAQKDINRIIAEGIAMNKSAYDIAKDLEKYVDPSARKDWEWSKVYPGTNRKVDYSAQRLARTMVSHAYQQAFVNTTKKNPFVTGYKWEISNSHRVCPICLSREGKVFAKDSLPLDHPNGMCTFTAVMENSMVDIADRIADWVQGKSDPELDIFADYLKSS